MIEGPLVAARAFTIGTLGITWPVVTTWGLVALVGVGAFVATRRLEPQPGPMQAALEMFVEGLDAEINATAPGKAPLLRDLIGALLIFVLAANWSSLIPGVEPPTAHLETDAALACIVFIAGIAAGIRARGVAGWLSGFAHPSWVMIPLNLVEQVSRHFSLTVRLFGNVMSGVFVVGIVLSLAGLLVPIPLMALDLLTGAVQAYIFATLALVFIGSSAEAADQPAMETQQHSASPQETA